MLRQLLFITMIVGQLCFFSLTTFGEQSCSGLFQEKASALIYREYLTDTLSGLEVLRNTETGLIQDKIVVVPQKKRGKYSVRVMNANTSATNIGLDLMVQLRLISEGKNKTTSLQNLHRTLFALEKMKYHQDTGLFFSWYDTNVGFKVVNSDVSAVDNIHLALALWTISETIPNTIYARQSRRLFDRMDFSIFYKPDSGLMGGNLKFENGTWRLEAYDFANVGSEARSIYSLCWALGLFRKGPDSNMVEKSVQSLKAEVVDWRPDGISRPFLRTWDAGVFQRTLSELLIGEQHYAPQLKITLHNYSDYLVYNGLLRGIPGLAYHSASQYGYDNGGAFTQVPAYEGKAGTPETVSTDHVDVNDPRLRQNWNRVMTPHAAITLAPTSPEAYVEILDRIKKLRSGKNLMYQQGLGFMDGYHVSGVYKGQVVPIQISLNQAMIALAIEQILSGDGLTTSARALLKNHESRARLKEFYNRLDHKILNLMN